MLTEQEALIQKQVSEISAQQFAIQQKQIMDNVLSKMQEMLSEFMPAPTNPDPNEYWRHVISTELLSSIVSTEVNRYRIPSKEVMQKQCENAVDYADMLINTIKNRS